MTSSRMRTASYTVHFAPEPPTSKEKKWIQTVPGKGWFVILRLYGALASVRQDLEAGRAGARELTTR